MFAKRRGNGRTEVANWEPGLVAAEHPRGPRHRGHLPAESNQKSISASKIIAMRAHIPSRNAQTWLLLYSAKSRSVVDPEKGYNVVIGWSRAPVGTKERSRNQGDVEKATTERMKRRGLGETWRREESARKKQKIERRHKVEESEMRRERRTKMKMDGT